MANNKVVLNNETLIDISTDTVNSGSVVNGYTFHDKNGNAQSGSMPTIINTINYMSSKRPVTLEAGYYPQPPSVYLDPTSDENISPKNIKLGVEILGVTGTYTGGPESNINWMMASLPNGTTIAVGDADYGVSDVWCAVTNQKGIIRSTDNGSTWVTTSVTSGGTYSYKMMYGGGRFVTNAASDLYSSIDKGESWTASEPSSAPDNKPIAYANGYWLIASGPLGSWSSTDLNTFTSNGLYNVMLAETPTDMVYFQGKWVATTNKDIKYSTNLTPTGFITTGVISSNYRCLKSAPASSSSLLVAGGDHGLSWSTDGVTWVQSNITSGGIRKIETNGSNWVAVGTIGVLQSNDGKNWNIVETIGAFNDVVYANNKWVACSNSNYGLYDSSNGIEWAQSNIASGTFYNVKAKNGRFIACGANGIYYASI